MFLLGPSGIYLIKFFNVTLHYTRVSSSLMVLTGVSRVRLGPRPRRWNHDYTKASVSGSPFGSSPMSSSGSGSMKFGSYASHPWPISYIFFVLLFYAYNPVSMLCAFCSAA